jgi:hypothetical protein
MVSTEYIEALAKLGAHIVNGLLAPHSRDTWEMAVILAGALGTVRAHAGQEGCHWIAEWCRKAYEIPLESRFAQARTNAENPAPQT